MVASYNPRAVERVSRSCIFFLDFQLGISFNSTLTNHTINLHQQPNKMTESAHASTMSYIGDDDLSQFPSHVPEKVTREDVSSQIHDFTRSMGGPLSESRLIEKKTKKRHEDFGEVGNVERTCVFMGPIGVGKTSLYGCFRGNEKLQRIHLDSQTKNIEAYSFVKTFTDAHGKLSTCTFYVYDTEGFTGNPEKDIVILYNLLGEICERIPRIHVIYYCLTAVRFSDADENTLRLVVNHGGPELRSRLKFIMTNAPARLVTKELREDARRRLSSILGHDVKDTDLLTTNLIDPTQFDVNDPLYDATMDYWDENKIRFQKIVYHIQDKESFRVNRMPGSKKIMSMLMVYRMKIALALFSIFIVALIVTLFYSINRLQNEINSHEQCRTQLKETADTSSIPEKVLQMAIDGTKGLFSRMLSLVPKAPDAV